MTRPQEPEGREKPTVWHKTDCEPDEDGRWYCVRGCPIAKRLRARLRRHTKNEILLANQTKNYL